ncbi:hypothetical protein [Moraxella boevrei]|uniref:hypothetical protein n=1 Tax=Faucicola boevrei TaxID=346665 RepID=UPI00373693BA
MFEIIDVILIVIAIESIMGLTKYLGKNKKITYTQSFMMLLAFVFLMWTAMVLVSGFTSGNFNAQDWFDGVFLASGVFITIVCTLIAMAIRKYGHAIK